MYISAEVCAFDVGFSQHFVYVTRVQLELNSRR
jgi:hypothetical protein